MLISSVFAVIKASIAIAVIMALGRLLLRRLFRMAIATGIRELFLAAVLVTAIGTAVLTETIGLSLALGAFLAGLLVSETEYRHQIAVDIEPVKGLLLGVFFVSVGLGIDLDRVAAAPSAASRRANRLSWQSKPPCCWSSAGRSGYRSR